MDEKEYILPDFSGIVNPALVTPTKEDRKIKRKRNIQRTKETMLHIDERRRERKGRERKKERTSLKQGADRQLSRHRRQLTGQHAAAVGLSFGGESRGVATHAHSHIPTQPLPFDSCVI